MEFVVLGLGSNKPWQGIESLELLEKACSRLQPLLLNFVNSSVYRTKPMYFSEQECFYNMAVSGFVDGITPDELLLKIHEIEASLGRDRAFEIRNGPRSIDIDIEIFGMRKISSENLEIPHPRLFEREFVLLPLVEILKVNSGGLDFDFYQKKLFSLQSVSSDENILETVVSRTDFSQRLF